MPRLLRPPDYIYSPDEETKKPFPRPIVGTNVDEWDETDERGRAGRSGRRNHKITNSALFTHTPTSENSNMVSALTEAQIQAELREILGHPNRDDEVREVHKVLNAQPNPSAGLSTERIRELVHEWFPGNNPEELFRAVMHSIDLSYDLPVETPAQIDDMPPHKRAARAAAWQRIGERLVSEAAAMRRDMDELRPYMENHPNRTVAEARKIMRHASTRRAHRA